MANAAADKIDPQSQAPAQDEGLGLVRLTTMVVTTCVGAGIFSLAGDLAAGGANTAAILISWVICFLGVLALAKAFCGLSLVRPELSGGIYAYANEGFGEFMGFTAAWGYWMSACLNNAGYGVMLFAALGHFFPVFGAGNNVVAIACASAFLWLLVYLLMHGVHMATGVNVVITLAKLVPLALFIVCVALLGRFDVNVFVQNFWGEPGGMALGEQIKSTMVSLVWLFVGIEGAVVVSGRAKSVRDVSRATIGGFVLVIVFYVLISVLSLGILSREEMAALATPSLGGVFEQVIGPVGAALINGGVAVSLMGTMLGFLIFASETPFQAAKKGIFPATFTRANEHGTPILSTLLSAGITQLFLIMSLFASSTYQFFYNCSVNAILVPYVCAAAYYAVIAWKGERMSVEGGPSLASARLFGSLAVVYTLFVVWSSGLKGVLVMCIALAPGLVAYAITQWQRGDKILPQLRDKVFALALVVGTIAAIVLGATGAVALM